MAEAAAPDSVPEEHSPPVSQAEADLGMSDGADADLADALALSEETPAVAGDEDSAAASPPASPVEQSGFWSDIGAAVGLVRTESDGSDLSEPVSDEAPLDEAASEDVDLEESELQVAIDPDAAETLGGDDDLSVAVPEMEEPLEDAAEPDAQHAATPEEEGGFWSALGFTDDDGEELDEGPGALVVADTEELRGDQHAELQPSAPPPPSISETIADTAAVETDDTQGEAGEEAQDAFASDAADGAADADAGAVIEPIVVLDETLGEQAAEEQTAETLSASAVAPNEERGGFWSDLGEAFGLSGEEADEPAESEMSLADAAVVEPEGSYDPEADADFGVEADTEEALAAEAAPPEGDPLEGDLVEDETAVGTPEAADEGDAPGYAEYEIVAVMVEPTVEDGEAAEPEATELDESRADREAEVKAQVDQILAEIRAAAEVNPANGDGTDAATAAELDYEKLRDAPVMDERIEIQKAQADTAASNVFTDFDYERLFSAPVVGDGAEVSRTEAFAPASYAAQAPDSTDNTAVTSQAVEPEAAEPEASTPDVAVPGIVAPEATEVQMAEADGTAPLETAAAAPTAAPGAPNEDRLGFWSSLGDSLGLGAASAAASDDEASAAATPPAATPAVVAQSVVIPAPAAATEFPQAAAAPAATEETVQPLVEASATVGSAGEQVVALTPSQLESARRAFAVPVRPGDVVEVRFYRNTRLDNQRYDIVVGDLLRVDVFDQPELSRESVLVLPDGYISLPLVGSLQAAGWTVDELSTELTRRLLREQLLDPRVSVAVIDSDKRLQAILNQTTGSGGDPIVRFTVADSGVLNLPYLEPIDVSGRSVSDLQELIRRAYREAFHGQLEVTVNLNSRAIPVVYVMGEVVNPIAVEVSGRFNPLMAVAAAGGFLPTAAPDEVRVVRVKPNGEYDQWAFDLEGGLDGELVNGAAFQLVPQDVVIVPPSGIATAGRWVDQWVRQLLPFSLSAGFGISYDLNDSDD